MASENEKYAMSGLPHGPYTVKNRKPVRRIEKKNFKK